MFLMIEKGIRGGICPVNKKNLKDCDENKELSYQWSLAKRLKLLLKNWNYEVQFD